ncbi:hypothetical protein F441_19859 [Phytophthora nicotianae CJ01A1]|uniref:Uncharacterized protein n=3 Tax=Phytophthora nicotianae TaxID=4792 RepID=W2PIU7_PHYN3|nr:hypothetical protein PPTG_24226 [Phytophthora nicotianae INRA-310]ETK72356.1 hypothetical protein L915_20537 [Phytophthora nicotianae]ETN00566.1 hypothetical protein PPTG_24226 [Phytophthora nicotianae INRA-310]ETP03143.1 hypothetical protein F441_19859 [Phytophthora nicotianae CJ01A1]
MWVYRPKYFLEVCRHYFLSARLSADKLTHDMVLRSLPMLMWFRFGVRMSASSLKRRLRIAVFTAIDKSVSASTGSLLFFFDFLSYSHNVVTVSLPKSTWQDAVYVPSIQLYISRRSPLSSVSTNRR